MTFNTNGGDEIDSEIVEAGTVINLPTPKRTGYTFDGWYINDNKVETSLTIEANITLVAHWTIINSYTVSFVNGDGTVLQTGKVEYGQTPSYNGQTPTIASGLYNLEFDGWDKVISSVVEDSTYNARYTLVSVKNKTKESYIIPDFVTSIGDLAFHFCTSLTSITIPNSVTSIGDSAFDYCPSLTSITIPNSVTSIGEAAFLNCTSLTSITIPNSVTSIGKGAFADCYSLTSIIVEEGNIKYDSRNNCNAIIDISTNALIAGCKNTIIPNSVTSIGDSAFRGCTSLTSITIPNRVTSIGKYAFDNCRSLTSITIPNSVTSIGDDAFGSCSSLASITISSSVTSIGKDAFADCYSLTSIIVEEGNIKYDSRNNCNAIIETSTNTLIAGCKNTIIPNSVTSIGDDAFSWCSSLIRITIPDSVTSIGDRAFNGCINLARITIPNSVTSIGDHAFNRCDILRSIYYGGDVDSYSNLTNTPENGTVYYYSYTVTFNTNGGDEIDSEIVEAGTVINLPTPKRTGYTFDGWYINDNKVEMSLTIEANTTLVAHWTINSYTVSFVNGDGTVLQTGKVEYGQTPSYNGQTPTIASDLYNFKFDGWDKVISSVVEDSTYNARYTLVSVKNKTKESYIIPDFVTSIGDDAFYYCTSLTSITIPDTVTSIGFGVFEGCTSLTIYCEAKSEPEDWGYNWNGDSPVVWGYKEE